MNFKAGFLGIAIVGLASACTPVKGPADGAVSARYLNENSQNFVAGLNPANVKVVQGDRSQEAVCKITSSKYETPSFQAPAKVNLPAYSQGAVNATLTCTIGEETKAVAFEPKNLSADARAGSAIGTALLCPICGLGVAAANAASNKDSDIYGFTELKLEI